MILKATFNIFKETSCKTVNYGASKYACENKKRGNEKRDFFKISCTNKFIFKYHFKEFHKHLVHSLKVHSKYCT